MSISTTPGTDGGSPRGAAGDSANGGLTFVEMMFAVALGNTANQVGKVMKTVRESPAPLKEDLWAVSPSITHLALVVLVIATSWVGWYHSSTTKS